MKNLIISIENGTYVVQIDGTNVFRGNSLEAATLLVDGGYLDHENIKIIQNTESQTLIENIYNLMYVE